METNQRNKISKFLSLILRHTPETIGLVLDENGWADVGELIAKAAQKGMIFSPKELILVVHSKDMHSDGFAFFLSNNGVWLTDYVPMKYIDF